MATLTLVDRYIYAASLESFLQHYQRAIDLLTEAIAIDPTDARLLRQRGHRRMTIRDFEGAKADFTRAAELEDGHPDEHEYYQTEMEEDLINIVLGRDDAVRAQRSQVTPETIAANAGLYKSTLQASIWYHLALSQYLTGEYDAALENLSRATAAAVDDNIKVAAIDWTYMTLRRTGRDDEAATLLSGIDTSSVDVTGDIHYLRRVQLYKGELAPSDLLITDDRDALAFSTQAYGVGNWNLYNGRSDEAHKIFQHIVDNGAKNAFAYMAAEADLARWDQLTAS